MGEVEAHGPVDLQRVLRQSVISRRWRHFYVAATVLWAGAMPAATMGVAGSSALPLALVVYGVGAVVCHQQPERSFHLASTQFPVCARCAGLYLGAAIAALWGMARASSQIPPGRARVWLVGAAAPAGLTLLYEWIVGSAPPNLVRAASGVPLGLAVSWLVLTAVEGEGPRADRTGRMGSIGSE